MATFEAIQAQGPPDAAGLLQTDLGISKVTARLLINRGITEPASAHAFLFPDLAQLEDPFLMPDMKKAAARILRAIEQKEPVLIYGDYDADGMTAAAVLTLYLRARGLCPEVFIPSRHEEGYGVHESVLKRYREAGFNLVITVDCGITAVAEIQGAAISGMEVILTDHHTPGPVLPNAYAILHPALGGYPFSELSGVGVAAKLIQALGGLGAVNAYLDLIALGTIADIVPLRGENRVFASKGIEKMHQNPCIGISALVNALDLHEKPLDAGHVSYRMAPCLNAPGRLGTCHQGVDLLTMQDFSAAFLCAKALMEQNQLRKELEREIHSAALQAAEAYEDLAEARILVVSGSGWHPGVIGIVASRLVEAYHRPAVVISVDGSECVGSARSIPGFHIQEAFCAVSDLLDRFGGHSQAAGLSLKTSRLTDLKLRLMAYARERLSEEALIPKLYYDGELAKEDITPHLHKEIEILEPFGAGNPPPSFLISSAAINNSRRVGKDFSHLKMALSLGLRSLDAIGFGWGDAAAEFEPGCRVDLLASVYRNEYRGVSKTEFRIQGLKRRYDARGDLDSLLRDHDLKIFTVFLSEFMYNKSVAAESRGILGTNRDTADLSGVYNILKHTAGGHLFLIHTEAAACRFLSPLMGQGLLSRLPLQYHRPAAGDGIGRNGIVLVPDPARIPFCRYHTIWVAEEELAFTLSSGLPPEYAVRLQPVRIPGLAGDWPKASAGLALSRAQLESVYRYIRSLESTQRVWPSAAALLSACRQKGISINGFQLLLALEIFAELGFVQIHRSEGTVTLHSVPNPTNRSLENSALYRYHRQRIGCPIQP